MTNKLRMQDVIYSFDYRARKCILIKNNKPICYDEVCTTNIGIKHVILGGAAPLKEGASGTVFGTNDVTFRPSSLFMRWVLLKDFVVNELEKFRPLFYAQTKAQTRGVPIERMIGFDFKGTQIINPFLDVTGVNVTNLEIYYGMEVLFKFYLEHIIDL